MKLLSIQNDPKTSKSIAKGYLTAILYLSPSDLSSVELCPLARIAGCREACLNTAGRGGLASKTMKAPNGDRIPNNSIQKARLARTKLFNEDLCGFMVQLSDEINALRKKADKMGLKPAVRLNGTSDIRWEQIPYIKIGNQGAFYSIMDIFKSVQFYDYTKIPNRTKLPSNYHLTYSYSGVPAYQKFVTKALEASPEMNLAVVFKDELPETYMGRRVINGDEHDLRFLDPKGVVVGLKAKGRARKDTTGFVV